MGNDEDDDAPSSPHEVAFPVSVSSLKQRIRLLDLEGAAEEDKRREKKQYKRENADADSATEATELDRLFDVYSGSVLSDCSRVDPLTHPRLLYRLTRYPVLYDLLHMISQQAAREAGSPRLQRLVYYCLEFALVSLSFLFLCALAQLSFDLPSSWSQTIEQSGQVPISFQTFGVLFLSCLLGWRRSCVMLLLYACSIVAGAPFAAKQAHGYQVLEGASGGYIMGFIPAGMLVGYLSERGWDRDWLRCLLAMMLGNFIIYVFGLLWLPWGASFITGKSPHDLFCGYGRGCAGNVLWAGLVPFIPGDLIKIGMAWVCLCLAWRAINAAHQRITNTNRE